MSRAIVVKDEIYEKNTRFLAVYLETKNSCLVLLSEAEDRLGTLAVAVPSATKIIQPSTSSILLGGRNTVTVRMLAERLASTTNKIALVSVFLKTVSETEASHVLLKLMKKVVGKSVEKEKEGVSA
ncbi:MAG: hypothetical protein U9O89_07280 [Thermoproteota archaeon]|nr:hypothetical protein [Thermoproteota archaeon]